MVKNKKVYVGLSADILHKGHINILKTASKYGDVYVGLLTDEAIASYKNIPHLNFKKRKIVLENIKYVKKVIAQKTLDYVKNLKKIKPDYVVHGDDWKSGVQKETRKRVIETLKIWSGKLIEPKYTRNISSSLIKKEMADLVVSPKNRVPRLKKLLKSKGIVRFLESHDPLTGLIIENLNVLEEKKTIHFDGMWSSSLIDNINNHKSDNSFQNFSSRIISLNKMMKITSKPLIFDADNGGQIKRLPFLVRSLEGLGVSAIIIKDNNKLIKNSLFKNKSVNKKYEPQFLTKKIKKICDSRISKDFMVITKIEGFIFEKGLNDALERAEIYSKAGADAILIHSKKKVELEIFKFAKKFVKSKYFIPLISIATTYSKKYENDLIKNNFKLVIYNNQLIKTAYPEIINTAKTILRHKITYEKGNKNIPIKEIDNLIKNDLQN